MTVLIAILQHHLSNTSLFSIFFLFHFFPLSSSLFPWKEHRKPLNPYTYSYFVRPITMQYSTIFLSALAAATTLAAPTPSYHSHASDPIRVTLSNQATELGIQRTFAEGSRQQKSTNAGPFKTVELNVDNAQKKDLRCQLLDKNGQAVVVIRGENTDITFADGGKGKWTFRDGAVEVKKIVCDPAFVKGTGAPQQQPQQPDQQQPSTPTPTPTPSTSAPVAAPTQTADTTIRVTLATSEVAFQTAFEAAGLSREEVDTRSKGPFDRVELRVGADVQKQDLRCQILDAEGKPVTVQRGENVFTTFADGAGGPWTFLEPMQSEVLKIVCDPAFGKE
ncbi:hypothetical protein BDV95DRAFT_308729 [Massariosphaeria phaeospora]|uniref:Uncharacterized protein n=1 Tax=Massariosphaeria phaeospora TaxID=100035 RepID=A0A7C8IES3_9PLEO|nr:hypothetical protein BDV95DRAFT_308729 [Massariosphaeria phaeospora]